MTPQETQHMIYRQLDDILSQTQRICCGDADIEMLENFSRYSEEFKTFLKSNSTNTMILERVELIPFIDVSRYYNNLWWVYLFTLGIYTNLLRDKIVIIRAVDDVKLAEGYYSSIQFLYKSECI